MKLLKITIVLVAAPAIFHWAAAQNAVNLPQAAQCIPANTFAELPAALAGTQTDTYGHTSVPLGSYERVSPDGRFVLRSFSGGRLGDVSLLELSSAGSVVAAHPTPLSNEAFPVQGTWRYLVDVNGDHYTLRSLLRSPSDTSSPNRPNSSNSSNSGVRPAGAAATPVVKPVEKPVLKPVFRGGMTGFYAAAAELPQGATPGRPGHVRIRSMSWPNANGDSETQGQGALVARTIEVDTARQRITADSGFVSLCNQRVGVDGPLYALPMISVDGLEFAALPQTPVLGEPTMRIFSFGDPVAQHGTGAPHRQAGLQASLQANLGPANGEQLGCVPTAAFSFSSGKTIFGHPQTAPGGNQHPGDLAYEYRGQVWWVHRGFGDGTGAGSASSSGAGAGSGAKAVPGLQAGAPVLGNGNWQRFNLAPYYDSPRTELLASAFPGMTQDGRIIYGATLKDCPLDPSKSCVDKVGYVTSDPFQSNAYQAFLQRHTGEARRQCITHGDVARERAAFAKLHGLGN